MSTINCPHCGSQNNESSAFCEECGKALPGSAQTSPRVVTGDQMAATAVGQNVQADQLRKQAGKAAIALFAVAILQVIGGVIMYFVLTKSFNIPPEMARIVLVIMLVLGGIFAGLGFWARVNPLPAAIVGLVLYVSVIVVDAVADPTSIIKGIIVKIIIIVVLIKAVKAGIKYKQLLAQISASNGPASG